ncbi:MAG: hypothetical protein JO028_00425 [Acidobacteriaceae bacterium]|nr:hypothetical protein [Acidobacteriaceae bacterium]
MGAVSTPEYRQRMEAIGVSSIDPIEGLDIVRRLLSSAENQIWVLKAANRFLHFMGVPDDQVGRNWAYPERVPSLLQRSLALLREKR